MLDNQDQTSNLRLFATVLPIFRRVSNHHLRQPNPTGKGPRRQGPPAGVPFYADLNLELRWLHETLPSHLDTIRFSEPLSAAVRSALKALELCLTKEVLSDVKTMSKCFSRLCALRERVPIWQASSSTGEIISISEFLPLFRLDSIGGRPRERSSLLSVIRDFHKILEKTIASTRAQKLPGAADTSPPAKEINVPHDEIRKQSNLAYETLVKRFKCRCVPTLSHAQMVLERRSDALEANSSLEILFEKPKDPSSGRKRWQRSRLDFFREERKNTVRWVDSKPDHSNKSPTTSFLEFDTICSLAHSSTETTATLRFRFSSTDAVLKCLDPDNGGIDKNASDSRKDMNENESNSKKDVNENGSDSENPKLIPLSAIISGRGAPFSIRDVTLKERFALALTIANSFLHLYEGRWWPKTWDAGSIYIFLDENSGAPDCRRPYLSTMCKLPDESTSPQQTAIWCHPYPHISNLGGLLVELLEGCALGPQQLADFFQSKGQPHLLYREAASACLEVQTFPRGVAFDELTFRQKFWTQVVQRLEQEFKNSFYVSVESLRDKFDPQATLTVPALRRLQQARLDGSRNSPEIIPSPDAPEPSPAVPFEIDQPKGFIEDAFDIQCATLHDSSCQFEQVENEDARYADQWLRKIKRCVHPLLKRADATKWREKPIKIAILDTGVEFSDRLTDIGIKAEECRSWISESTSDGILLDHHQDADGHGTHAAGLLLEVAPHATIYAAKVFEGRSEAQSSNTANIVYERIVNAIDYAVEKWEVDIISMSFGLQHPVEKIDDAIVRAYKKRVLIFASASNEGGNAGVSFPATSPLVVAVFATNGIGQQYPRNPTPSARGYNFATLGVAVPSWWPEHLGKGPKIRTSGTSAATPIAAGIAANVMEIVQQHSDRLELGEEDENRLLKDLRTAAGMKKVFKAISEVRDGYDYLEPWELVDDTRVELRNPVAIVNEILRITRKKRP